MKQILQAAAALGLLFTAPVAAQQAESPTMRQALVGGFEIKSVAFMPEDMARRVGGSSWTDGVVITLQKGSVVMFCHMTAKATLGSGTKAMDNKCNEWR